MSDSKYDVDESTQFSNLFKKVNKKYKRTFDDDFGTVLQVIRAKLEINNGDGRKLPKTDVIGGLGESIQFPFCKTHIYIEEAKKDFGRLIFLVDKDKKIIFLTDVYHKNNRENHDANIIRAAHYEFKQKYYPDTK